MLNPDKVQNLFDNIAPKYDFMNNIISLGTHYLIKKSAVGKLKLKDKAKVLDLCCGTGDITKLLANKKEVESVTGADFSENMLDIAKRKNQKSKIEYVFADCTKLPFEDNSFDAVTMFFGLRNIEDKEAAIKEVYRVLKLEGQFMHLDFEKGNCITDFLFDNFVPFLAKIFFKTSDSYKYLVKTKQQFYTPKQLSEYLKSYNLILDKKYSFLLSTISAQTYVKN